jgi:hypothetical protein
MKEYQVHFFAITVGLIDDSHLANMESRTCGRLLRSKDSYNQKEVDTVRERERLKHCSVHAIDNNDKQ